MHNELASVKAKMRKYFKYSKHDFYVRYNQLGRQGDALRMPMAEFNAATLMQL